MSRWVNGLMGEWGKTGMVSMIYVPFTTIDLHGDNFLHPVTGFNYRRMAI